MALSVYILFPPLKKTSCSAQRDRPSTEALQEAQQYDPGQHPWQRPADP